jgi:hypothetical protein
MAKHFALTITDDDLTFERENEQIDAEAVLDGIYVLRTDLEPKALDATATVRAYKDLATVEHAFRSLKTVDLEVRPIHHRRAQRVRAHVLLCMLAYYLEWHMRQALKSILFDDHDKAAVDAARASIVRQGRTLRCCRPQSRNQAHSGRLARPQPSAPSSSISPPSPAIPWRSRKAPRPPSSSTQN